MKEKPSNLAGNVRRLRVERGLTQEQLAEQAHVANATISRIERGRIDPSTTLTTKLAASLGVKVDELLGNPKKNTRPTFRPAIAKLVAAVDGLDDGAVDDVTKAIRLILAAGMRTASRR